MTERQQQNQRSKLVYTPGSHIPLGEPVKTESGHQALKVQYKGRSEVITLESLCALVFQANEQKK